MGLTEQQAQINRINQRGPRANLTFSGPNNNTATVDLTLEEQELHDQRVKLAGSGLNLATSLAEGGVEGAETKFIDRGLSVINPALNRTEDAAKSVLASKRIPIGSEAYNNLLNSMVFEPRREAESRINKDAGVFAANELRSNVSTYADLDKAVNNTPTIKDFFAPATVDTGLDSQLQNQSKLANAQVDELNGRMGTATTAGLFSLGAATIAAIGKAGGVEPFLKGIGSTIEGGINAIKGVSAAAAAALEKLLGDPDAVGMFNEIANGEYSLGDPNTSGFDFEDATSSIVDSLSETVDSGSPSVLEQNANSVSPVLPDDSYNGGGYPNYNTDIEQAAYHPSTDGIEGSIAGLTSTQIAENVAFKFDLGTDMIPFLEENPDLAKLLAGPEGETILSGDIADELSGYSVTAPTDLATSGFQAGGIVGAIVGGINDSTRGAVKGGVTGAITGGLAGAASMAMGLTGLAALGPGAVIGAAVMAFKAQRAAKIATEAKQAQERAAFSAPIFAAITASGGDQITGAEYDTLQEVVGLSDPVATSAGQAGAVASSAGTEFLEKYPLVNTSGMDDMDDVKGDARRNAGFMATLTRIPGVGSAWDDFYNGKITQDEYTVRSSAAINKFKKENAEAIKGKRQAAEDALHVQERTEEFIGDNDQTDGPNIDPQVKARQEAAAKAEVTKAAAAKAEAVKAAETARKKAQDLFTANASKEARDAANAAAAKAEARSAEIGRFEASQEIKADANDLWTMTDDGDGGEFRTRSDKYYQILRKSMTPDEWEAYLENRQGGE